MSGGPSQRAQEPYFLASGLKPLGNLGQRAILAKMRTLPEAEWTSHNGGFGTGELQGY